MEDESGNERHFNETKDNEIFQGADIQLVAKYHLCFRQRNTQKLRINQCLELI